MRLSIVCLLICGALSQLVATETPDSTQPKKPAITAKDLDKAGIGKRIPDFILPDSKGEKLALTDFNEAKQLVVVFMGTACPIGNAYVPILNEIQKKYGETGAQVIGINANLSDDAKSIAKHVKEFKVNFPVLVDKDQAIANLFGAERTPEAFILDGRRNIQYRGRIDDRFGYLYKRGEARTDDLENALKEIQAKKKITLPVTEAVGCLITRKDRSTKKGDITYTKQISRLFQNRCAECHHPGTAAPFSLTTYEDAQNWSAMIKEVVVQRRMPPWNADPRYGHFSNDLRMTQTEIDTLVTWMNDGMPKGDDKDLPEPKKFADGWVIGKPDVVFKLPKEVTVQAKGEVKYQYYVTPTNFKEDVWVQAAEARPGNRSVVHHIIVFYRMKGSSQTRGLKGIVGTAPGEEPMLFPVGTGKRIPAGAELVWQMHYTPTGKVEKDRSEVGFIFCKKKPEREVKGTLAINRFFRIPAGADNHKVVARKTFDKDVELLSLMPHMHLRGKDFLYRAHYPDGRKEIILNVPTYDFNWQHRYRFAKPLQIPKGTKIECIAHFDNSKSNPANPDPKKAVYWGDQTWEEMMIGWISYVDAKK